VHNIQMPLFEYACRACGQKFEYLTRAGQTPACPSCASAELEKQLSVFAVSSSAPSPAPFPASSGACGMCGDPRGPGSCSVN
jgi:putative FmdB family regulatory protein